MARGRARGRPKGKEQSGGFPPASDEHLYLTSIRPRPLSVYALPLLFYKCLSMVSLLCVFGVGLFSADGQCGWVSFNTATPTTTSHDGGLLSVSGAASRRSSACLFLRVSTVSSCS